MSIYEQRFEGCDIKIESERQLTIDGKEIEYEKLQETQQWSSRYLPYTQYESLIDLAKAIIRDTSEFTQKDNQQGGL
jgi:HSP20 family molecular chaperone IbpA